MIQLFLWNDRPELTGCGPVDGQANVSRCALPASNATGSFPRLNFWASDASSPFQTALLGAHQTALLIGPPPAAGSDASPPVLTIVGESHAEPIVFWDGSQLTLSAQDGDTIDVSPSDGCQTGATPPVQSRGLGGIYPPSSVACSPVTGGTLSVDVREPQAVDIPGTAVLPPGGSVSFARPQPAQPPGSPPPSYWFGPVVIVSGSDQPLQLDYDGRTLGIGAADGLAIQMLSARVLGGFTNCVAIDGRANEAGCDVTAVPLGQNVLMLMTAPAGGLSAITVPAHSMAALIGPLSIIARSQADEPADLAWDGQTATVTLPSGSLAGPASIHPYAPQGAPPPAACQIDATEANVLDCTPAPGPSSEVDFAILTPITLQSLSLPFTDRAGAGTLVLTNVGPDIAPGGVSVDVTLSQGDTSLRGGGALRPRPGSAGPDVSLSLVSVYVSLDDERGGARLLEGILTQSGSGWSGDGQEVPLGASDGSDTWSARGAPRQASLLGPVWIASATGSGQPSQPPATISGGPLGRVPAGQSLSFLALPDPTWTSPGAALSLHWYFGDGSDEDAGIDNVVSHAYSAPGLYTVVAVATDPAGVSAFGSGYVGVSKP